LNSENQELIEIDKLDIPELLLKSMRELGFTHCTPIQSETLPYSLAGEDVAGQAQTGTGKTIAFLIATYAKLLREPETPGRSKDQPRAIIIAPTRELAIQIHSDAETLGKYTDIKLGLAFGGAGYEQQRKDIAAGVDILIGTPGRTIDFFKQHIFNLKAIQVMVLDEADRMFDLGFITDIRFLLRRMPKPEKRLNMLFSATLSLRVSELAYEHMNNPRQVLIETDQVTADNVEEAIYFPAQDEKIPLLLGLLRGHDVTRTMVFVNTKRAAEDVERYLVANGYDVGVLSGDVPQKKRSSLLKRFINGTIPILIATDVAARGLHIPEVSHVFNYDLPQDPEDYVHRIGRTARAGASGDAISFACEEFSFSLADIEDYIGHKIPIESVTDELLVTPNPPAKRKPRSKHSQQGRGGQRNKSDKRPQSAKKRGGGKPKPR
jgi:ATP-dependent RNA helicase RhlB